MQEASERSNSPPATEATGRAAPVSPKKLVVVPPKAGNPYERLPGTVAFPDGKKPVELGSGTVTSMLSKGGMAVIYQIWNPMLEVKRAVKLLRPDHTDESAQRFETEMKISAKLHHPNIVEIYAVGKWNDLPYIEMEEIEGSTVEGLIGECGCLPVDVCTSIGIMVGRALNYAHNQKYVIYGQEYHGVIHRDLKPSNVMVTRKGIVKLMDFGIAKPTTASLVTCGNVVVGTLQYLSPEQLEGTEIDVRADIYSLGAVMYEMITGGRAFPERQLAKLVPDILDGRYRPLEEFDVKVPAALRQLVHQCLQRAKERRVQDALEFLRALGRIHKKLTDDSPEQVLARFMWGSKRERVQVGTRRRSRLVPTLIWAGVAVLLSCTIPLVAPLISRFLTAPRTAVVEAGAADESTPGRRESGAAVPAPERAAASPGAIDPSPSSSAAAGAARPVRPRNAGRLEPDRRPATQTTEVLPPKREAVRAAGKLPEPTFSPAAAAPRAVARTEPSLIDKLKASYGTDDLSAIFTSEIDNQAFAGALGVAAAMTPVQLSDVKVMVYRLRALRGVGDKARAEALLRSGNVEDGEFCLAKAEMAFRAGDIDGATALVERASRMPVRFMPQQTFRPRLLYSKALCSGAAFDIAPSAETKKEAMAAWYSVKSLLRGSPDHRYYVKADEEIRRISRE